MSRFARLALAPALFVGMAAHAQTPAYPQTGAVSPQTTQSTTYDTARIISVVPVTGSYASAPQQRCYRQDGYANDGYNQGGYGRDGYYGGNGGYGNGYGNGGYNNGGSGTGRMVAGVLGSVVGAVLGGQMGNGAGRYIGSAVGSAVGGAAGQGVYDQVRRQQQQRQRPASITVCDPEPVGGYSNANAQWYDVTYSYAGRTYTSRMPYRPTGDTIRVRVDVLPLQ